MTSESYRYTFDTKVPITEVRYSILLSALAAEGVHGRAQVLLDAEFLVDEGSRTCAVDASTPVGLTISQVFTGLLTREFGEKAFSVQRLVGLSGHDSPHAGRTSNASDRVRGSAGKGDSRGDLRRPVSPRPGPDGRYGDTRR